MNLLENIIEEAKDLALEIVHQLAKVLVRAKEGPRQGRSKDLYGNINTSKNRCLKQVLPGALEC